MDEARTGGGHRPATSPGERLARWIAAVVDSPDDLRTIVAWAHFVGVSVTTLCETCRLLGIQPHDARDLARILRALQLVRSQHGHLEALLDVSDRRTYRKLLARAALTGAAPVGLSVAELVARQTFIVADSECLTALIGLLS